MTEHLPECPMSTKDAICCSLACICDALRACEDRVRKDDQSRCDWCYSDGVREALDAAREAVAALPEYQMRDTCIAAIEALRRKENDEAG